LDDRQLIKACLKGKPEAQEFLFRKFSGKMLSVCMRYARHRLEAEDLVQDGFIRVFEKLHTFKFKGSLEGWIRRIMVNTAIRNYQKASFQRENIGVEDYMDMPLEADAIQRLSEEELINEIEKLPDGYRMVFNLYVIEGYKHNEIADMLGIGESTSRSQLVKARRMLQQSIARFQQIVL
jgi:RNA polymerase sigma-70 factor (ECF subfamily)